MDSKEELIERVLLLMKYNNKMTLTENTKIISEQIPNQKLNSSDNVAQGVSQTNYKTGNDYCNRGKVKDLQWENNNLDGGDNFQGKKGYCRLSDTKQNSLSQPLGDGAGGFFDIPIFPVATQDAWYAVFAVWLAQQVEVWKFTNLYLNKSGYEGGCEKNKLCVNINGKNVTLQDLVSGYLPEPKPVGTIKNDIPDDVKKIFKDTGISVNEQQNYLINEQTELQKRAIACGWKTSTVNGTIADVYGYEKSKWQCPKGSNTTPAKQTTSKQPLPKVLCYNEDLAVYKPYDNIDIKNITSRGGRLDKTSFKRYTGYIPSYSEVIQSYGFGGNVKKIITALDSAQKSDFFTGLRNVKKGEVVGVITKPTAGNVHDVLSLLQIVSVVIPVAGPFISLGLGLVDSAVYYAEGETNMAALTLGLSILFDLPILKAGFGNIGKQAISNLTDKEIVEMSKALLENNTKNLPENLDEILKAVETEMGTNPAIREQYEQMIKEKSKEILSNKNIVGNLSPNSKTALSQASKGQLAGKVFTAGTVGVGLPLTAKGGYETFKPLIRGNIKTQVEAEGYKWDVVKKMFGSNGSVEDNQKLLDAWLLKWRPGLEVPTQYQTETYKQTKKTETEKLAQDITKSFELDNSEKMVPLDVKTIKPMMSSLTNPKIIATRDSLEKTYDDYEQYLGYDE